MELQEVQRKCHKESLEEVVGGVAGSSEEVSLGVAEGLWWVELQEVQRKCH